MEGGDNFRDIFKRFKSGSETSYSTTYANVDNDYNGRSGIGSSNTTSLMQPNRVDSSSMPNGASLRSLASNPTGLSAVWIPAKPIVDIIFVHGLGGTVGRTWSYEHNLDGFWPSWLPLEPELSRARIHAFGYTAAVLGPSNTSNIFDFAKDLLFKMKYEYVNHEKGPPIGSCPIIFVAHSMGGLVTKKAYITGKNDKDYKDMIAQVKAILFLSTPHRGCHNVKFLHNIMQAFNLSKDYMKELSSNGTFLQNVNHDFGNLCSELQLFSFYETAKTSVGGIRVVDHDSGVMNLPNESSTSMNVDHHAICKFQHREDPGYKYIKNTLISIVLPLIRPDALDPDLVLDVASELKQLGEVLSIDEHEIANELDRFRNVAKHGTCKWIDSREWFIDWLRLDPNSPNVLWISGPPAAGKSVLAAAIVDKIRNLHGDGSCQYHNLSFADMTKRSASYLVRSLAHQIGTSIPSFRRKLLRLSEDFRVPFGSMNAGILWEKIFPGLLFKMIPNRPLYWIIDGLDESDSLPTIFQCLSRIKSDYPTLKILLVSRPTADIEVRVKNLPLRCSTQDISPSDTEDDIRAYVRDLISSIIPTNEASRQRITDKVLAKASGNFLWVTLVLKALEQNWHTQSDINRVLNEFHSGMTPIYDRMMEKLDDHSPRTGKMASLILTWATFSFRPLSITELRIALQPEFKDLISLEDTIRHVCGGFVQVLGSKVGLIHETARYFLINGTAKNKIQMISGQGHEYLAIACLQHLSSTKERQWRTLLKNVEDSEKSVGGHFNESSSLLDERHPFLMYAAKSWAYHLSLARTESQSLKYTLFEFLKNDFLAWINALALSGDLKSLIRSAQYLKAFIKRRQKVLVDHARENMQEDELEALRPWAVDLVRLVGKFGGNLVQSPSSIYKLVPPFCPDNSMVRKFYGRTNNSFSVSGISNPDWDDCHARLSVDPEDTASRVLATVDIFAALIPQAHSLVIWHAETCEELRRIRHDEYLTEMAVNKRGDLISTSGTRTIKIWEIGTGHELACNPKTSDTHVIALAFGVRDEEILVGYQDHSIICYKWKTHEKVYAFRAEGDTVTHGGLKLMKFSPDVTQVALASKSKAVEIWDLQRQSRAYRYMTAQDAAGAGDDCLLPPEKIQWHPDSGRVYILYHNMGLVDWNPLYEEQTEHQIGAKEMICSPCGTFLLTSDNGGAIMVYSLPDYVSDQDRRFRLVYRLEYDEFVRDLAFHPDGQRFYDIRGSVCNVWEPEALVQPDEPDSEERGSNSGSYISSGPAEAFQDDCSRVTAVANGPLDYAYCCGRDDGTLSIHDMTSGIMLRSLPGHATDTAIIALTWSTTGNWIASADESGHVLVRKVQIPTSRNSKLLIWRASDFRVEEGGLQLIFSPDDKYLLVASSSSDRIWDISAKTICQTRKPGSTQLGKWITHPNNHSQLVLVNPAEVHIFEWSGLRTLTPQTGICFKSRSRTPQYTTAMRSGETENLWSSASAQKDLATLQISAKEPEALERVNFVIRTHDNQSIIFETLPNNAYGHECNRGKRIELLSTASLDPKKPEGDIELQGSIKNLSCDVSKLLGTYQNQVVFFNHQHWLCSWDIHANAQAYRKHLFLPKDWLNAETIHLSILTPRGTLLCPRNGEVAVVKGGIKF